MSDSQAAEINTQQGLRVATRKTMEGQPTGVGSVNSTKSIECLTDDQFSARELRVTLAKIRQKKVPNSTFQYWKSNLGISPNEFGFYDKTDLYWLARLVRWLSRSGSMRGFTTLMREEINAS